MHGLKRIILIDSFIPGIRMSVDVDGHAIINGTNGAGKTSTLKLIALFYGSKPGALVPTIHGRDSFTNFYLPRPTSMIIFEYERDGGLCCVVVYRGRTGDKNAYRFMTGGFTQERFSKLDSAGERRYLRPTELRPHWASIEVSSSRQIEVVEHYRAIIQNDGMALRKYKAAGESTSLRALAAQYCCGNRKTRMRHLDRVCTAILNRSGNLEAMRAMLADIMLDDSITPPAYQPSDKDRGTIKEIHYLRKFEQIIPDIRELTRLHRGYLTTETELKTLAGEMLHAIDQVTTQIMSLEQKHEQINGRKHDLTAEWEEAHAGLIKARTEANAQAEELDREADSLETQYRKYQEQRLTDKESAFDQVEEYIQRERNAESRYRKLSEGIKEEEDTLQQEINKLTAERNKRISQYESRINEQRQKLVEVKQAHLDRLEEANKRLRAKHDEINNAFQPKRDALISAREDATARAKYQEQTEEEKRRLKEARDQISRADHELTKAHDHLDSMHQQHAAAVKQREKDNAALDKARRRYASLEEREKTLHKLIYPDEKTWLHQLRQNDPDWVNTIGKLIPKEVLERSDLSPEQWDDQSDTVFGWSVDITHLPSPEHAHSEERLRAQLDEAEQGLVSAREKVEACEKALQKSNKNAKDVEQRLEEATSKIGIWKRKKEAAEGYRKQLDRETRESVADRRRQAKAEAKQHQKALNDLEREIEEQQKAIDGRAEQEKQELERQRDGEKAAINETITALETKKRAAKSQWGKDKDDLEQEFAQRCAEAGIDTEAMNEARKALDSARQERRRVEGYASIVIAYREWMNNQWPRLPEIRQKARQAHEKASTIADEEARQEKEYEQKKATLDEEQTRVEQALRQQRKTNEQFIALKPRMGGFLGMVKPAEKSRDIEQILTEAVSQLDELDQSRDSIERRVEEIYSHLGQFSNSRIGDAWERASNQKMQELGADSPHSKAFLIHAPLLLEEVADKHVSQIREVLIESIRSAGEGLSDYFGQLKELDRQIKAQARTISQSMEAHLQIDALSSMRLVLESKVRELDYWRLLEAFSREWRAWGESGRSNLPGDELMQLISQLSSAVPRKSPSQLKNHFELRIDMTENGRPIQIRTDRDLDNATSNGLKYLALCVIFIAISRGLCKDLDVALHWPIDELGILHGENITRLFSMLDQAGIVMVGGFPSEDPNMLRHFTYRHRIDFKEGIRVIAIPDDPLTEKIRRRQAQVEHAQEAGNASA